MAAKRKNNRPKKPDAKEVPPAPAKDAANILLPSVPYDRATNVITSITEQQLKMSPPAPAQTESAEGAIEQQKLAEAASGRSYMSPETVARMTTPLPLPDPNSIADRAHEGTLIPAERVRRYKMMRINPIRDLTAQRIVQNLDDFYLGYLRNWAMMMDAIIRRDDTLSTVVPKRMAAIGRKSWAITIPEQYKDDPEAEAQKAALEYFYTNLRATHAVEQNQLGGVSLLARQMVEAVGFRYVAHEILWRQTDEGVTAVLNDVPLWFFENRTGRLRFLPYDTSWDGDPLDEGAWMVTVGQGIMEACAILYFFKHGALQDWGNYSEKHGSPGLVAITDSVPGDPNWINLENSIEKVGPGFTAVINMKDKMETIDWTAQGEIPMPSFIERLDQGIATLWMGGDLSTMSGKNQGGDNTGASLQGGEMDKFEQDDCQMVTETCNMQLDPMVIRINFGEGVTQKAFFSYGGARMKDLAKQITIDTGLAALGFPLSQTQLAEDYEREAATGDDVLKKPVAAPADGGMAQPMWQGNSTLKFQKELGNESLDQRKLITNATQQLAKQQAIVLAPLKQRLKMIQSLANEDAFRAAVQKLRSDLPAILLQINRSPVTAKILENTIAAALVSGLTEKAAVAK